MKTKIALLTIALALGASTQLAAALSASDIATLVSNAKTPPAGSSTADVIAAAVKANPGDATAIINAAVTAFPGSAIAIVNAAIIAAPKSAGDITTGAVQVLAAADKKAAQARAAAGDPMAIATEDDPDVSQLITTAEATASANGGSAMAVFTAGLSSDSLVGGSVLPPAAPIGLGGGIGVGIAGGLGAFSGGQTINTSVGSASVSPN